MESIALKQYPRMVWRDGQKMLWNPINRKALKNRPEERVRLRIIEYLLSAGWSKHRISTEEAVRNPQKGTLRTDIICYNQQFEPKILVECKAEHISLTQKTAEQVARYNQNVQAPLLLMSNGVTDFWYRIDPKANKIVALDMRPDIFPEAIEIGKTLSYWQQRGFVGESPPPPLRKWILPLLENWVSKNDAIRYLLFQNSPSDIDLSQYYRIFSYGEGEKKLALGCLATPYGGTRIVGILNKDGKNKAVLEINLDLFFKNEKPNSTIYSEEVTRNIDVSSLFEGFSESAPKVTELANKMFQEMSSGG